MTNESDKMRKTEILPAKGGQAAALRMTNLDLQKPWDSRLRGNDKLGINDKLA
jgi:hypothetical protein